MSTSVRKAKPTEVKCDALVVGAYEGSKKLTAEVAAVDKSLRGAITDALGYASFHGKPGECVWLDGGKTGAKRVLVVGMGKAKDLKAEGIRAAAGAGARAAMDERCTSVAFVPMGAEKLELPVIGCAVAEGVGMASYEPGMHQTDGLRERSPLIKRCTIVAADNDAVTALREGTARGDALAGGVRFARDLVNEPSNVLTPTEMANRAKAMAAEYDTVSCKIWGPKEIEKNAMGGIIGVGRGSTEPSQYIQLEYKPAGASKDIKTIAFVGKGLTFDTGGISLKPPANMELMKFDMGGAAAVLGGFHILGAVQPNVRVLGFIPAVENMPDGSAIKPGDLLTMMSGLTVEVNNTDAEGRLVLADALHHAKSFDPEFIVDAATLTGACMIALGDVACGLMSEDDDLVELIRGAADDCGDAVWRLPLQQKHRDLMKGHVGDLINTGPREGGASTAAGFLSRFAEGARYAHLDIAGTVWVEKPEPMNPRGATGFGARLFAAIAEATAG